MKILVFLILGANMYANALVKISEVLVKCDDVEKYKQILQKESKASVEKESGVLILYAMQHKDNPCRFSIVESYKDQNSYEKHTASKHFQHYKQSTKDMVESLTFIQMDALNPEMLLQK